MRRKILFLTFPIILSLSIVGIFSLKQYQVWAQDIEPIKKASDFTLSDIHSKTFRLSQLKGKVVLLDFWATWCPFCRASIPILDALYNDYKDKGLEVVGIALEYDGGKRLRRFAKERKISYHLLLGNEELTKEYSAYGVPTRFLINRKGQIVEKFIGFQDKEILEAAIKELL